MKILVTGAGGFLGSKVVEQLLLHGYDDIRCLLRDPKKKSFLIRLQNRFPNAKLEYVFANLQSKGDVRLAGADVNLVFHLAAAMKGAAADMFLDSVVASRNLLDAVVERKPLRIVLVSSFGVLGVASLKRGALLDEQTPLEPFPQKRDPYSHAKLRQELLFREYESKYGFELVVLRPGVIYGPGGAHLSARLGLSTFGVFLDMGGRNKLPLTFVDNCANAIVVAGTHKQAAGQAFHVHDEDILTCRAYLRRYRKQVRKFPSLRIPYPLLWLLAWCLEKYNALSRGQLPSILTRYKVASLWRGNRFDNRKLKSLGWEQLIPTSEALNRTFEAYRRDIESVHEN